MNRKHKLILGVCIGILIIGLLLYIFVYREGFAIQCALDQVGAILKTQSGLYPTPADSGLTCMKPTDIINEYYTDRNLTALQNAYNGMLGETGLIGKFFDFANVVAKNPEPGQTALVDAIVPYVNEIMTAFAAIKTKLQDTKSTDAKLINFVDSVLATYGPTKITDMKAYVNTILTTRKAGYQSIIDSGQSLLTMTKDALTSFKTFELSISCTMPTEVVTFMAGTTKDFEFYELLKLLYPIVSTNETYPGLTFDKLKASAGYATIKAYYLNPDNMFTAIKRDDKYLPSPTGTTTAPQVMVPRYNTDDEYMQAITSLIDREILLNVDKDGKLVKTTTNTEVQNLYSSLVILNQLGQKLSLDTKCYTANIKAIHDKVKAIVESTATIMTPLPTAAPPSTSSTAPPSTSSTAPPSTSSTAPPSTGTSGSGSSPSPSGSSSTSPPAGTTQSTTGTTKPTITLPEIFDRAKQEEWKKFWDDLAVLFTGRSGDVGDLSQSLMNLTQEQRTSICSTWCDGLYTECTDLCRLAKCSNCDNEPAKELTGAGDTGSTTGYSTFSYDLLGDNNLGLNLSAAGHYMGPYVDQKDSPGMKNVFAPFISINGSTPDGYMPMLTNNPNDPVTRAYIAKFFEDLAKSSQ